jgi:hypothetical protein
VRGPRLERLVSGGQTGVDRAALDAALALAPEAGFEVGGWCPRGRWAEDGPIPARYPLRETPSADPAERTAWNVRDADGTLILTRGALSGGTLLSAECAEARGRPLLVVDLDAPAEVGVIDGWRRAHEIRVLNVAGPRESEAPGVGAAASALVRTLLEQERLSREAAGVRR